VDGRRIRDPWFGVLTPDCAALGPDGHRAASGDIGYTLGHWETVLRTPVGDSTLGRGHYVTLWRRQPDGTWKVALDIGNQAEGPE
jgi:ketosteroid isomerase-like protein